VKDIALCSGIAEDEINVLFRKVGGFDLSGLNRRSFGKVRANDISRYLTHIEWGPLANVSRNTEVS
jgi:hypothetical protein